MGSVSHADSTMDVRAAISEVLQQAVDSDQFLGLSFVAIDAQGNTIYSGAHGHQSFKKDTPMTLGTAGWMASMSKVMTSIAAMQVVEKGLIGLDDDLAPLVPEFRDIQILTDFDSETQTAKFETPTEKITLRRLLSHTSGFAYDQWNPNLLAWTTANGKDADFRSGEWKTWIRPLVFNPGTAWLYSQGIDWAGKVIELLTHQTLEEYMHTNIWSVVGMTNTTFFPLHHPETHRLELGTRLHGPTAPLTPETPFWPLSVRDCMGGCGIYSTAEDYGKMLAALITPHDNALLKRETVDLLFRPQLSGNSHRQLAVARGMGVVQIDIPKEISVDHGLVGLINLEDIPGRRKKGSVCWDGMSNPNWMVDRVSGITCVLFTQILPSPDVATKQLWAKLEEMVYKYCVDSKP